VSTTVQDEAAEAERLLAKGGALNAIREAARTRARKVRFEQNRRKLSGERCSRPSVLIVEDEPQLQQVGVRRLQRELGIDWCEANTVGAARRAVCGDTPWDVAAIDLNLEGEDGAELVSEILLASAARVVVVITGLESQDARVRLGASAADPRVQVWRKGRGEIVGSLITLARDLAEQRASR